MSLRCAWCWTWLRKETPVGLVSHTICQRCAEVVLRESLADDDGKAVKPWQTH